MTIYRIVCTEQEAVNEPARRAHIVAVGTNGSDSASERWTLLQVLQAMSQGHQFYTRSPSTGKTLSATSCYQIRSSILRRANAIREFQTNLLVIIIRIDKLTFNSTITSRHSE